MFKNVIIGVNENEGGLDAIALGRKLVDPDGALTLVHVHPGDAHPWRGSSPPYEVIEREDSLQLLTQVREDVRIDAHLRSVAAVTPGRGLHTAAESTGADLLVVGSSRNGLLGRVLVGDDTRNALNGASCAVAIAPAGYEREPGSMREIGVGYDGSTESDQAIEIARRLGEELGAKLSAFKAVCLPAYAFSGGYVPLTGKMMNDLVEGAREQVAALGVEPHAAYGDPAEELAVYSASLDLLIVGSRSYGPLGRLVHGSTSQRLARIARCPLLVLPRATRPAGSASGTRDRDASVSPVV